METGGKAGGRKRDASWMTGRRWTTPLRVQTPSRVAHPESFRSRSVQAVSPERLAGSARPAFPDIHGPYYCY